MVVSAKSNRAVGEVLEGEDAARLLLEATLSGDDKALQGLLLQPQWTKTMLEEALRIYQEDRPSSDPNDARTVSAYRISNLQWASRVAALNGHSAILSTLFAFAQQQGIEASEVIGYWRSSSIIEKVIQAGHASIFPVLASSIPNIINTMIGHSGQGHRPLYTAVKWGRTEVVAVLLELGADPWQPFEPPMKRMGYPGGLLSLAAGAEGPRLIEMLLEHGLPLAQSDALFTAALSGQLDTMRLLLRRGADVNEVSNYLGWTPLHVAAAEGKVDAMKLLEDHGARSEVKDPNGNTPANLLQERNRQGTETYIRWPYWKAYVHPGAG